MKTRSDRSCTTSDIAASPRCLVQRCNHGKVHVSVGEITLRLNESTFLEVAATMSRAASKIDEQRPPALELMH